MLKFDWNRSYNPEIYREIRDTTDIQAQMIKLGKVGLVKSEYTGEWLVMGKAE